MSALPAKPSALPLSSDPIYVWRKQRLERFGFSSLQAGALARKSEVDLHRVNKMLGHGCTIDLAVRILL